MEIIRGAEIVFLCLGKVSGVRLGLVQSRWENNKTEGTNIAFFDIHISIVIISFFNFCSTIVNLGQFVTVHYTFSMQALPPLCIFLSHHSVSSVTASIVSCPCHSPPMSNRDNVAFLIYKLQLPSRFGFRDDIIPASEENNSDQ